MNKSTLTIEYTETTPDRIPREDALLLEKAVSACDNAYAPYSHFKVGAAVRLSDGMIVTGCRTSAWSSETRSGQKKNPRAIS